MSTEAGELERDRTVIAAATPGPWDVNQVDDNYCMTAYTVARPGGSGELDDHDNNVAVVLLQEPRFADVGDGQWRENAEFIARARVRWPAAIERIESLLLQVEALERENVDLRNAITERMSKPR